VFPVLPATADMPPKCGRTAPPCFAFGRESHNAQGLRMARMKRALTMASKAKAKTAPKKTGAARIATTKTATTKAATGKTATVKSAPNKVTLKHLAASLAEQHRLTRRQSVEMLTDLVAMIAKHLKKGERIRIAGLGILQVRRRPARMGRNPATGEAIRIKASKKVAFRAAKELKMAI
jgi:DNA-binding protein HU-beta